MRERFDRLTNTITCAVGSPWALLLAVAAVLLWAASGPALGFSETWMLLVNTGTTICTFLVVFVIQSSQNRDGHAIQLKLDELIRSHEEARNEFRGAETLPRAEVDRLEEEG